MSSERPRRILAVDFGDRRTGLAATDYTGTITTPLPALVGRTDEQCAADIRAIVDERETQVVVVGLPLTEAGDTGPRALRTLAFVERLRAALSCPVDTCDERSTTDEAHALLKDAGIRAAQRKKLADSVAALVILNRYRTG